MDEKLSSEPAGLSGLTAFSGLKVIEIGSWLAVPNAAAMLADLGARVVKVESEAGDPARRFPRPARGQASSAAFAMLNRNKESVVLDLNDDADRARLETLLGTADILVNNLRPAQLDRLDLDADALALRHPRLIVASLTGLGLRGPEAASGGFDVGAFWARSGFLSQVTQDGSEPAALAGGYGDLISSLSLFAAIVAGLLERTHTGRGGLVETSLLQTAAFAVSGDLVSHQAYGRSPRVRPRLNSRTPFNNSYQAADGRWFFLTCVDAMQHLSGIARALGKSGWSDDPRFASPSAIGENAPAIIALLDDGFAAHPLACWAERFAAEGVTWERVSLPSELLSDPQVAANEMMSEWTWGDTLLAGVASPFSIFRRKRRMSSAAPGLGAHNGLIADEAS